ncbi:PREDICTED: E3 ubiquitin-protein ligase TRIM71-like [Branchiostoma belcheri]|uniref:E3 ubiquitin-protein ligase TRIM71-like n=1 Tax=Branchiostoma belcheri TaxID=7741 RepID=A0A6P4Z4X9_BRABE|nr:PREDICTED: E3 ubiquitin-protein ligase TRIM71-like [Branchiostoma belcheri]
MDAESDVNPNPMYLQSTTELIASPGPGSASSPNPMYTQNMNPQPTYSESGINPNPMYLQSTMEPIASPGPARNPNPMYTHNASNPYPTHSRNDVNSNPMYLQSSPGPTFKSNKSENNPCTQTSADTHQQAFSRPATNNGSEDTQASLSSQSQPAAAFNNINDANDVLHARNPNLMYVPNVQHPAAHGCDVKQKKITFGGRGTYNGVAVSADNEIFVTDASDHKRVQVFSINGTFLRLFSTVVPGESKRMRPYGVASDVGPGYLWVLGTWQYGEGHVVQYSKNGQPIKKFDVSLKSRYPVIAMDVRNNKVIVGDQTTIMMFDPNGSRLWSSEVRPVYGIGGVTSDKEGNILLTDGSKTIQKYNPSGVKIFEFGTYGRGEGQLNSPKGICLDTSGHIIVANYLNHRVDMFTSQGEFVRTIASISYPWAVAMGPCGELVLTGPFAYTVTIFPRHMVLP